MRAITFSDEELAEFVHIQNNHAALEMFDIGYITEAGQLVVPPAVVRRIRAQLFEPYAELRLAQKENIRALVASVLKEMGR